jgi:hypothetical protein
MLSAPARRGNRQGTIGPRRRGGDGTGGTIREGVAVPRRGRARGGGRRVGRIGAEAPARSPPSPGLAARGRCTPRGLRAGHHGQPAPAPGRQRGVAEPRQHPRPPRPLPPADAAVHPEPRRPPPRLPRRHGERAAARLRLHGVRRRPRPPRLRGLRAGGRAGPPLRRLHLRLAARPRGEREGPRPAPRGARDGDGRSRGPFPHRDPAWAPLARYICASGGARTP